MIFFVPMAADKINSKMGEGTPLDLLFLDHSQFLHHNSSCIPDPIYFLFVGTFGQVLECWDRERKEMVAVKIVRGIKKYREAAMIEIEVLQQLAKHDKGGNR